MQIFNKRTAVLFLIAVFFLFQTKDIHAQALVTISSDGTVHKNVLGETTDYQISDTANKVVGQLVNKIVNVVVSQVDAKVQVAINGETETTTNVFNETDSPVLEIKKDKVSDTILIKKVNDGFGIQENGVTAITSYNVTVDPKLKNISINTNSGERTLNVLPSSALNTLISANIISSLKNGETISVSETDNGELIYTISGNKNINFFNLAKVDIPVVATVSATSGKVENIDEPRLLRIFGFLFPN